MKTSITTFERERTLSRIKSTLNVQSQEIRDLIMYFESDNLDTVSNPKQLVKFLDLIVEVIESKKLSRQT